MANFVKELETFEDQLRKLGADAPKLTADALNAATKRGEKSAIDRITAEINLEPSYVDKNIDIGLTASKGRLEASVRARRRSTTHQRFGAKYVTTQAKATSGARRRALKGRELGGIPPGRKAAGLGGYKVWRNKPDERWTRGFFIEGNNGNILTVRRTGPGRDDYETIYGMSVAQAFKYFLEDVREDAVEEFLRVIDEGL